jgi:mannose/fructose/N-acetylgalactosamine-specific phosphotransferase system component IIC
MHWLWLTLIGGVVGLDATSFPQAMLSRPLVAGALAGLVFSRPLEGMLIGAVIEIFDLSNLPIGAARYPDSGTATVAGVGAFGMAGLPELHSGALLLAVVFSLLWEYVTGISTVFERHLNERLLMPKHDPRSMTDQTVERVHILSTSLDFVRAALLALTGTLIGALLLPNVVHDWRGGLMLGSGSIAVAAAMMLAGAIGLFGGLKERRVLFLLGAVCGSLILLFT